MLGYDIWNSRINIEASIMAQELPQFHLYRYSNSARFIGWQGNSRNPQEFMLELHLSRYYPDEIPCLHVVQPNILYKKHSGTVNEESGHAFHTLGNGPNRCVKICHFPLSMWNSSQTCVGVFLRGIIWLEAYAEHLITGQTIAEIIDLWVKKQKSNSLFASIL